VRWSSVIRGVRSSSLLRQAPWWPGIVLAFGIGLGGVNHVDLPSGAQAAERVSRDPIAELRVFEDERRRTTDYASLPAGNRVTGADPLDLTPLPGGDHFAAVLGGRDAVVVIDASGVERARVAAPVAPSALAVLPDRARSSRSRPRRSSATIFVGGGASDAVARLRFSRGELEPAGTISLGQVSSVTDLAAHPDGTLYAVEDYEGRIMWVPERSRRARTFDRCHGPSRVLREDRLLFVDCLLDHEIRIYRVDEDGRPSVPAAATLKHDGPIWSVDAHRDEARDRLLVALGGVEDHPLDRSDGSFGFIDSFVTLYELDGSTLAVERRRDVNAGELGVVTPKWIDVDVDRHGAIEIEAVGFATDVLVTLRWPEGEETAVVSTAALAPGIVSLERTRHGRIAADTLLDAWLILDERSPLEVVPVVDSLPAPRSAESRVGELLFFTNLMAPWNPTEGRQSRFTCETCHSDGYGDGRVHFTGRGTVHATARALRGLGSNRPYFSRALDRTMADMVHAEFRVANRGNGRSPWFAVDETSVPWLRHVADRPQVMTPIWLRQAFMTFLMELTHEPNPGAAGRDRHRLTRIEQRGAELFRDRCEACHQARLAADRPDTRLPFDRWSPMILTATGPIVWGTDAYEKTGVLPYVHDRGARVPSLRRLYKRYPYFTNGSAPDLETLLQRAGWAQDGTFTHDSPQPAIDARELERLDEDEREALEAFLRLL
jgi:hypothetical protein